jgi:uncharacterized protein YyaL (SSP411 family)
MSANLLDRETSPYLLQHRDNPVHWRPWGQDALRQAREVNKPILLSVGYAACHWCHVMAHESFEDEHIARQINENYIPIKVDREERPDIDALYQTALALLGQRGGWPLTMFLTPAGEPFWGGTYFSNRPRYGLPAFPDVLTWVAAAYHHQPDKIAGNAALLRDGLERQALPLRGPLPSPQHLAEYRDQLHRLIDDEHGGLAGAPKFPNVPVLLALWRHPAFRPAVINSLDHMCQGGIYDHLGGGFSRYSTDETWLVPHFEKMLYDNAALIEILTLAWQETGSPLYAQRIEETIAWLDHAMLADGGAFAASLDADSDGEEGKYYVWSAAEIAALLDPQHLEAFFAVYDVSDRGNWDGVSILHRNHPNGRFDPAEEPSLAAARRRLLAIREQRPPPGRDDKVLADWNGMVIAALAQAAFAFDRPDWLASARRVLAGVCRLLGGPDARLAHSARLGRIGAAGLLDDYAHLARAALLLHETTGDAGDLALAVAWTDQALRHFADTEAGGFFLAADDADDLIVRTKPTHDHATPSGNAVMVEVLARLAHLTGAASYRDAAEQTLIALSGALDHSPASHAALITAADLLNDAVQVVLVGHPTDPATAELRDAIAATSLPTRILQRLAPGQSLPLTHPAAGKLEAAADGAARVFICRGPVCGLPVMLPAILRQQLDGA